MHAEPRRRWLVVVGMGPSTPSSGSALRRVVLAGALGLGLVAAALTLGPDDRVVAADRSQQVTALPKARCDAGSRPEPGIAGRVPAADFASGRAAKGYTCNTRLVGRTGTTGGFKVLRYRDARGNTCAFYDAQRMFPLGLLEGGIQGVGTAVLDMNDPRKPRRTATLVTPGMLSPHESLLLHRGRGLLVAVTGNLLTAPGMLDVYDVKTDCRSPRLLSSTPAGILGHESGFSPDGKTFYASAMVGYTITAVDLTNPRLPIPVTTIKGVLSHGVRTSPDGRTLYVADLGAPNAERLTAGGLRIFDVSEIQDRKPFPRAREIGAYTWPDLAIPQVPEPMRIKGREYVLMVDEFTELAFGPEIATYDPTRPPAIARLIDVTNPARPFETSALRLQVHLPKNRRGPQRDDPGAQNLIGGYVAHYCSVPRYRNPKLVACSYIGSGLRVFDVRDPQRPREVAYFNRPGPEGGAALSAPAWDTAKRQLWYTDADTGFWAVRVSKKVWPRGL